MTRIDTAVLKGSMRGIRKEIDDRSRRICELVSFHVNPEKRFRLYGNKPPQDKSNIENKCLTLYREIRKLKVIKAELNLIIHLKEMNHA